MQVDWWMDISNPYLGIIVLSVSCEYLWRLRTVSQLNTLQRHRVVLSHSEIVVPRRQVLAYKGTVVKNYMCRVPTCVLQQSIWII